MIPVSVVTGFLGAGKSTLLRRILRDPAWADSAVIVNEFGEIALDHELIAASEESCVSALHRLPLLRGAQRPDRDAAGPAAPPRGRRGAAYARVLIETSGLADPGADPARADDGRGASPRRIAGIWSRWSMRCMARRRWSAIRRRSAR